MSLFFQLVVSGLTTGAIYAALALALVLIFRATSVVNFGQGEMATFSAYCAWQLMEWGVPLWIALLVSLAGSFAIGVITFRAVIRPLMKAPVDRMRMTMTTMEIRRNLKWIRNGLRMKMR